MGFILTPENYYSEEANKEFMSVSQFKDLVGTLGKPACEAKGVAKINGTYKEPMTTPMLVGSYVDAYFEGTIEQFKLERPYLFLQRGEGKGTELKSEYRKANEIIARIEQDEFFMKLMAGEKQRIITGELFGVMWKGKIDSYLPKTIVDLKIMKSLHEYHWTKDWGRMNFVQYWGYDIQATIYRELDFLMTGVYKPFVLACASKEEVTDIEVIGFSKEDYKDMLSFVESQLPHAMELKNGIIQPTRCETCDYCKATKKLSKAIHHSELVEDL